MTTEAPVKPSHEERMINSGVEIDTKQLGKIRIRELTLEDSITLITDIGVLLGSLSKDPDKPDDGLKFLTNLVAQPETLDAIRKIAARSSRKSEDDFKEMSLTDWLKIVAALKTVMDWEEMKDLFFQIVPPGSLASLQPKKKK